MRYLVFALAVSTLMLGDFALGAHENMPTGAPSKCLAMKYKTAAKAALDKARCFARAVQKEEPVKLKCWLASQARFQKKWTQIETKYDCNKVHNDDKEVQLLIEQFVFYVMEAVLPTPCESDAECQLYSACPGCECLVVHVDDDPICTSPLATMCFFPPCMFTPDPICDPEKHRCVVGP